MTFATLMYMYRYACDGHDVHISVWYDPRPGPNVNILFEYPYSKNRKQNNAIAFKTVLSPNMVFIHTSIRLYYYLP